MTICKWLDFLVFADKDDKTGGPVSQHLCGTLKNSHTDEKKRGGLSFSSVLGAPMNPAVTIMRL